MRGFRASAVREGVAVLAGPTSRPAGRALQALAGYAQ
jgi:hypothetical protein